MAKKKKEGRPKKFIDVQTEKEKGNLELFFAYVRRDTVNQAAKVAPGVIKAATNDINEIVKDRII